VKHRFLFVLLVLEKKTTEEGELLVCFVLLLLFVLFVFLGLLVCSFVCLFFSLFVVVVNVLALFLCSLYFLKMSSVNCIYHYLVIALFEQCVHCDSSFVPARDAFCYYLETNNQIEVESKKKILIFFSFFFVF
jgi:hypothetical protein